jgi:hypothetical protein
MNGSTIDIRTGSEGPRHDPYHYEEITVTRPDGRKVVLHQGLAEWMTYFDGRVLREFQDRSHILQSKFEIVAGVSVNVAAKAFHEKTNRPIKYHACGQKHLQWVSGFPGEQLLHCTKCGDIVGSTFNRSAIE